MRRCLLMIFLGIVLTGTFALGQNISCDSTYTYVDDMPTFGGTDSNFAEHFLRNIKIAKECYWDKMYVFTWVIDREGNMTDIDVPGFEEICKTNMIEQLREFPRWKPGKLKGTTVCVKMTVRMCIKTG